jgi:transposase InsO family protein
MKKTTSLAQRIEIGERSNQGEREQAIATVMGLSLTTVRQWRRQWQAAGRAGLKSPMGRPASGVLGTWPEELKEAVRQMRRENPGWGPETVRVELALRNEFQRIPCRSRLADFLAAEGLTRPYERHRELPQPAVDGPTRAHEEWEMDAQGMLEVAGVGKVSLINVCDVFTSLKIDSYPCMHKRKPSTSDYQLVLRRAFVRFGLPERFALDHDSVYYDNTSASPYPTQFHLWAIALGIAITFGRKGRPTDQATVERTHQIMTQQALKSTGLADEVALQAKLKNRLEFLAHHYPSRSLAGQPPLVAFPEAVHSGRPYRPEWELELLRLQRVYDYLAQGRWFRQVSQQGQFSLGSFRYGVGLALANQSLEITFDPMTCEFVCLSEDAATTIRLAAQGLTKQHLMGEVAPLFADASYQLALPFSLDTWRQLQTLSPLEGRNFIGLSVVEL